jgi:hypothetical protein
MFKHFFHLPSASLTLWCTISGEYFRDFSKEFKMGGDTVIRDIEEDESLKKSRDTAPLNASATKKRYKNNREGV